MTRKEAIEKKADKVMAKRRKARNRMGAPGRIPKL